MLLDIGEVLLKPGDSGRRLREIDRFCRDHSIRHLRLFGSILGDREDEFEETADPEDFFRASTARLRASKY